MFFDEVGKFVKDGLNNAGKIIVDGANAVGETFANGADNAGKFISENKDKIVQGVIVVGTLSVVPEKLRKCGSARSWRGDQFAALRLSSSRDMSR